MPSAETHRARAVSPGTSSSSVRISSTAANPPAQGVRSPRRRSSVANGSTTPDQAKPPGAAVEPGANGKGSNPSGAGDGDGDGDGRADGVADVGEAVGDGAWAMPTPGFTSRQVAASTRTMGRPDPRDDRCRIRILLTSIEPWAAFLSARPKDSPRRDPGRPPQGTGTAAMSSVAAYHRHPPRGREPTGELHIHGMTPKAFD